MTTTTITNNINNNNNNKQHQHYQHCQQKSKFFNWKICINWSKFSAKNWTCPNCTVVSADISIFHPQVQSMTMTTIFSRDFKFSRTQKYFLLPFQEITIFVQFPNLVKFINKNPNPNPNPNPNRNPNPNPKVY